MAARARKTIPLIPLASHRMAPTCRRPRSGTTTTEFQTINAAMTLDEFKFIYWWEWGHRFLGRLIGMFVLLPLGGIWIFRVLSSQ